MLLDVSVYPPRVIQEAPEHLILRALRLDSSRLKLVSRVASTYVAEQTIFYEPSETVTRGEFTCMEYDLPLDHVISNVAIAASPFIVSSWYKDLITEKIKSWTLQLKVEKKGVKRWLITLYREDQPLVTLVDDQIESFVGARISDVLPLTRLKLQGKQKKKAPRNYWECLLENAADEES